MSAYLTLGISRECGILAPVLKEPAATEQAGGQQVNRPLPVSVVSDDGEALAPVGEQRRSLPLLGVGVGVGWSGRLPGGGGLTCVTHMH